MFLVFCNTKSYSSEEATFNITKNTIIIFVQDNVSKGSFDSITSFNLSCSICCHSSLLVGPCHQPFKNFVTPKRRREGKYLPERRFFAAIEYPQGDTYRKGIKSLMTYLQQQIAYIYKLSSCSCKTPMVLPLSSS